MNAGEGFFAPPGASRLPATRWREGAIEDGSELVAEEVPVALVYYGISHAVMLASPLDLEDFAVGFSLSEGIVESLTEIHDVEISASERGMTLDVTIGNGPFARLKRLQSLEREEAQA